MKCPIDQTEMEKGVLLANGTKWQAGDTSKLYKVMFPVKGATIIAYKCPNCGKVELKAEENK